MQRPSSQQLPLATGLSGRTGTRSGQTGPTASPTASETTPPTTTTTTPPIASPATSPNRRSLLRGGLALGAAAGAGLAGELWTGDGSAAAATNPGELWPGDDFAAATTVDYPSATWAPASTANYTASDRPTAYPVDLVVIHVTQETFDDTISLFQDPAHAAAAHYVVRSADGAIDQCVREHDIAWHAGNWDYNTRSIGIEHEGWVDQPAYFTTAMYHASAALTAGICDRYGVPKDRDHIIGHYQVPGTDHTDPGPDWDWVRYIRLVNRV